MTTVTADTAAEVTPATWRVVLSFLLTLAGLGISIYLTIAHFAKVSLVCPTTGGLINCQKVTTSAESYFPPFSGWPHLPVAVLGLAFYLVMVPLYSPWAWRAADRRVHLARLGLTVVGMAFALYLVACELVVIGNICEWCTTVHIVTFFLFVLAVTTVPPMLGWGAARADDA